MIYAVAASALVALVILPVFPKRLLLMLLVAGRSLCDIGVAQFDRVDELAIVSGGIAVAAIIGAVLSLLSDSSFTRVALLWCVSCFVGVWSVVAFQIYGIRTGLLEETIRLVSIIGILVIAHSVARKRASDFVLISWMMAPAVIYAISGLVLGFPNMTIYSGRLTASFSHPNAAAAFFGVGCVVGVLLIVIGPSFWRSVFLIANAYALLLTGSLGGIVAASIGAMVVIALTPNRSSEFRAVWCLAVPLCLVVSFPIFGLSDRLSEFGGESSKLAPDSFEWRLQNWRLLVDIWRERPVFGYGWGSTSLFIQPLGGPPHSAFVQVLVEAGVVGVLLACGTVAYLAIRSIRSARRGSTFGTLTFGLVSFALVNGFESNLLGYTAAGYLLAALFGISLGAADAQVSAVQMSSVTSDGKRNGIHVENYSRFL
ncbi:hypothetical protein CJ179_10045 [Rhodococcus sp. ACS1]|uniref:O-antigen ligase family protein n=1 Tax=Rhodococcus TaxID=1827 RepID=UPI000BB0F30E|nr:MULTISPECIES: O-antigen ligase family protein [Rhodococcus]PBC51098.1 hypothetical protein CJ179_10045 [Rhodococcus sp. ACS1]QSE83053.1 O-antigen ligase family protein [Rhodococcus koreensis]